jgi:hypothetical protein
MSRVWLLVQQTIENGGGDHLVTEDVAPLGYHLVGGDEHAAAFVASSYDLKEETGGLLLEGQVATGPPWGTGRLGSLFRVWDAFRPSMVWQRREG